MKKLQEAMALGGDGLMLYAIAMAILRLGRTERGELEARAYRRAMGYE